MSCSHMTEDKAIAGWLISDSDESAYLRGGRYPGSMVSRQQPLSQRQQDKGEDYGLQEPMRGGACMHTPMIYPVGGSGGLALFILSNLSLKHTFFSIAFSGIGYSSVYTMPALLGCSNWYLACHYCINPTFIFVWSYILIACLFKELCNIASKSTSQDRFIITL